MAVELCDGRSKWNQRLRVRLLNMIQEIFRGAVQRMSLRCILFC
jgi:hypothetical protein